MATDVAAEEAATMVAEADVATVATDEEEAKVVAPTATTTADDRHRPRSSRRIMPPMRAKSAPTPNRNPRLRANRLRRRCRRRATTTRRRCRISTRGRRRRSNIRRLWWSRHRRAVCNKAAPARPSPSGTRRRRREPSLRRLHKIRDNLIFRVPLFS